MATQPTNLPVPSESPRDLKFNAGKIDEFVSSLALKYIDRFGKEQYTIEGLKSLILEAIYNLGLNPIGSFQGGATLTAANDIIQDTSTQVWYRWDDIATLPKIVPAGSTPASAGGTGKGKWLAVDVTDVLRRDLAAEGGVRLVNGALAIEDANRQAISYMKSYNTNNITPAILESKSKMGYVYLPDNNGVAYNIDVTGNIENLKNTKFYVDDGVTININYNDFDLLGKIFPVGRAKFVINSNYNFSARDIPKIQEQAVLDLHPVEMAAIPFAACTSYTISGDTFSSTAIGASNNHAILVPISGAGVMTGLFTQIGIGETITAHVKTESGNAVKIGIMLRCAQGWVYIRNTPNAAGSWQWSIKPIGGSEITASTGINTPDNNLLSYSAGKSAIGISLQSRNTFNFVINGVSTGVTLGSGVAGDILEIGWVVNPSQADSVRVTGLMCYKSEHGVLGKPPLDIAVYGDSTADEWPGSFEKYLAGIIDGKMGTRTLKILNYATAGATFGQQFELLKQQTPNAYFIVMVAGTNEGQGGATADQFAGLMTQFADYVINTLGRVPVWVEPWMWYSNSFINNAGANSVNYDGVAQMREAGKRVLAGYGDRAICITTTHQLPAPVPAYFNSNYDPLLRDDIHQSELGYKMYAEIIASAILKWHIKVNLFPSVVGNFWLGTGVTVTDSSIKKGFIDAVFNASVFGGSATLMTLPRWNRPSYTQRMLAYWSNSSSSGTCLVTINTNGQMIATGAAGATSIIVHGPIF